VWGPKQQRLLDIEASCGSDVAEATWMESAYFPRFVGSRVGDPDVPPGAGRWPQTLVHVLGVALQFKRRRSEGLTPRFAQCSFQTSIRRCRSERGLIVR
jgi:hypothetical protein